MKLPPQPVTALVYTAAAHSANLWTPESAQGQMLEQLGFTLATCPPVCMPARARETP
jgi:iron complex transport system substrate-binding protein